MVSVAPFTALLRSLLWVAPFTGAWIEIRTTGTPGCASTVAPFTGAWIEICLDQPPQSSSRVAPFTGAWIEILIGAWLVDTGGVAPFTGAWIEICSVGIRMTAYGRSLPSRERGLK